MIARLLVRSKPRSFYRPSTVDDVLVIAVGLLALASMLITTITADIGTVSRQGSSATYSTSNFQIKAYVSTVLFVLVASLSKMPLVLWLIRLKPQKMQQACTMAIGCTVFAYMIASATSIILQCQMPRPWDFRPGQCIPSVSFYSCFVLRFLAEQNSDHCGF